MLTNFGPLPLHRHAPSKALSRRPPEVRCAHFPAPTLRAQLTLPAINWMFCKPESSLHTKRIAFGSCRLARALRNFREHRASGYVSCLPHEATLYIGTRHSIFRAFSNFYRKKNISCNFASAWALVLQKSLNESVVFWAKAGGAIFKTPQQQRIFTLK